jgi:CRISPR-associated protein Csb2
LPALRWLEAQSPPEIIAPRAVPANASCKFYVPDNTSDKMARAWKNGDITAQIVRTEKMVRPNYLKSGKLRYVYRLAEDGCPFLNVLRDAARGITHLGWGVDMVTGDAQIVANPIEIAADEYRWQPAPISSTSLRVPTQGTFDDLARRYSAFLKRLSDNVFRPVPPLRVLHLCKYRRSDEPPPQLSYRVFELRHLNGSFARYPQSKLIKIAGMVRHLAIKTMKSSPPPGADEKWVETYIAGHAPESALDHRQLSYVPLPSIRPPSEVPTGPAVRRILIIAPLADEKLLDHVARRLAGNVLEPEDQNEFAPHGPPLLLPIKGDSVTRLYTRPANVWASVTPVILPGHDDHKPQKTSKLIGKTLAQSGVSQPCEFEWSAFSRWPKSLSAHKYDRSGRHTGYHRPAHLRDLTAVHVRLTFEHPVPGPLAIGAGRHCGFGLMAATD